MHSFFKAHYCGLCCGHRFVVIPSSEGSEAIEHHLLVSGALNVHRGEMDFFDQGSGLQ